MSKPEAEAMKQMLGEAILLGTLLAEHNYAEVLQHENGKTIQAGINRLRNRTLHFLRLVSYDGLADEDIFPLYHEIQRKSQEE